MNELWALTSGEYSDYRVHAVFASKEVAEATARRYSEDGLSGSSVDHYSVTPMPLEDAAAPENVPSRVIVWQAWRGTGDRDVSTFSMVVTPWEAPVRPEVVVSRQPGGRFHVRAEGRSKEAVVKAVADRWAQHQAEKAKL